MLNRERLVLGIESSCDDSCASIVSENGKILSNVVISQNKEHEIFGGVVPEIASRSHLNNIESAVARALAEASVDLRDLDAVASTCGPGLIGGLIVGCMFGKTLSSVLKKPFIAINHLEGHALIAKLTEKIDYPYLLLSVSGGHCQFVSVKSLGEYSVLGATLDDAAGEAFDKVAKLMELGFPGGPEIEKRAISGDKFKYNFPKPTIGRKDCDMSFSGLKTAVRLQIEKMQNLSEQDISDLSASFQYTVGEVLAAKTSEAINIYEKTLDREATDRVFVLAGGVAANKYLRGILSSACTERNYRFVAPDLNLCTDNAAMIAYAGLERLKAGLIDDLSFAPRARWPVENSRKVL